MKHWFHWLHTICGLTHISIVSRPRFPLARRAHASAGESATRMRQHALIYTVSQSVDVATRRSRYRREWVDIDIFDRRRIVPLHGRQLELSSCHHRAELMGDVAAGRCSQYKWATEPRCNISSSDINQHPHRSVEEHLSSSRWCVLLSPSSSARLSLQVYFNYAQFQSVMVRV